MAGDQGGPERARSLLRFLAHPGVSSSAIGFCALLYAYWLSSPRMMLGFDFDNASHFHHAEAYGNYAWQLAYTWHMALVPIYKLGHVVVGFLGGSTFTGFRVVNALAIGIGAGFLALTLLCVGAPRWVAALTVVAWLTTSNVVFLVRTFEDDCLSIAWMGLLVYLLTPKRTPWRAWTPLVVGLVFAGGALTNYSMLVWAPVVLLGGTVHAHAHVGLLAWRRVFYAAAIAIGFVIGLELFRDYLWLFDSKWSRPEYFRVLTTSTKDIAPNQPSSDAVLNYLALHPLSVVTATFARLSGLSSWRRLFYVLLLLAAIGFVWPFRRGARRATRGGRLASLSCAALVLCSVPAAWKADPTYHERMVHVPFCLAVLMGSAFAVYKTKRFRTRLLQAMALAMGGFLLVVNARAIRAIPPGDSWMARFRRMSENHPEIQAFVFAQPEFGSGGYGDFDKLVSLRLALPNHVVLSPGEGMARWDVSPRRVTTPEQYKSAPLPNAWLSPEAKALLGL